MRSGRHFHNYLTVLIVATVLGVGFAAAQRLANQAPLKRGARTETATFAGGCFWSLEAAFRQVKGVTDTVVGYTGQMVESPAREATGSHRVDHLEACQVTFDPAQISYEKLVEYFFKIHDPTATDRKGSYIGSPSRLVVFFHNAEQEAKASAVKERLPKPDKFQHTSITEIWPEGEFSRAEEYHQRYFEKHGLANCKIQP